MCTSSLASTALELPALCKAQQASAKKSLTWSEASQEGDRRYQLEQLDLAEGCYRQALRQVKREHASLDDQALCLSKLAGLLQRMDETEEATTLYKKAIRLLIQAHGKDSVKLLPDLSALAAILENDGELKPALKFEQRAVDIAQGQSGAAAEFLVRAKALHQLGHLQATMHSQKLAEINYQSALSLLLTQKFLPSSQLLEEVISDYTDLLEKDYGPPKKIIAAVNSELLKDRLINLQQKRGIGPSAFEKEVTVRMAKEAMDKIPTDISADQLVDSVQTVQAPAQTSEQGLAPPAVPSLSTFDRTDATIADQNIDLQKVSFYERMIAVDIKSLGPEHPSVARDLCGLSALYMARGEYSRSTTLLLRALSIYEKVYGPEAVLTNRTRALLELVNENQTAEQSGAPAASNFVTDLPHLPLAAQKIDLAIRLNYLASLCYSLGKVADAEKIYGWAVAAIYYCSGDQNLLLAAGLNDYARVLRSAGDVKKATLLESDAKTIRRRVVSTQVIRSVR